MSTIREGKSGFFEKVKEHKTEIIIGGGIVLTIIGAVLITKNWDTIQNTNISKMVKNNMLAKNNTVSVVSEAIQTAVVDIPSDVKVIDVSRHIRNLHDGWKASPEKVAAAIKNGIELMPHQTWVDDYIKSCA